MASLWFLSNCIRKIVFVKMHAKISVVAFKYMLSTRKTGGAARIFTDEDFLPIFTGKILKCKYGFTDFKIDLQNINDMYFVQ